MTVTGKGGGPSDAVYTLAQRIDAARCALAEAQRGRRRSEADCAWALAQLQRLRRLERTEAAR